MKRKTYVTVVVLCLIAGCAWSLGGCSGKGEGKKEKDSLVVFNYGDYIDRDVIKMFEKETGIDVKYEEYITPEDMYTKYQSGGIDYDVICTSDYMIERMILDGEAQEIDTSRMEYLGNIDEKYLKLCQTFDKENAYAIPYLFGTVGILYNTEMVEEEIDSWSVLWDEKYKNQIIMENSVRDAFIAPLKLAGHSINTTSKSQLWEAQKKLMEQKPLLAAYLVDETKDAMISEDAALGVIYSGDATVAMEANENLDYVVPKEGTNIWFDCWMIPRSAKHKKEAELFIDFMNRPDVAMMNFDYIWYGTPNTAVYEALDEEAKEDATIFPDEEIISKCEVYQYLGEEMDGYYSRLWKELKAY
ncbi:MAG: ABC transporter substrate-binding protein [Eubacteriales bacterium]|nr:ABC transporter substrate-binding protein [Eubacteriales bacterium]